MTPEEWFFYSVRQVENFVPPGLLKRVLREGIPVIAVPLGPEKPRGLFDSQWKLIVLNSSTDRIKEGLELSRNSGFEIEPEEVLISTLFHEMGHWLDWKRCFEERRNPQAWAELEAWADKYTGNAFLTWRKDPGSRRDYFNWKRSHPAIAGHARSTPAPVLPGHLYPDGLSKIIKWTPDDSFSDFTNRVTITGHEENEMDVIYAEERIQTLNGHVGWYGYNNDFKVYYSNDQQRRCRNPRLNIIESVESILFELQGGIHQSITYVDVNETYCIVTVSAKSLVYLLILALEIIAAGMIIGDPIIYGKTQPVGTLIAFTGVMLALNVLGSVGNFQYEIWAQPLGKIKRTVQATADDLELQNSLGVVIPKQYEDPLCYSQADCQKVADWELMIARLQRKRVSFTKIADLRDECGDTIILPHPKTGDPVKLFITDLKRTMIIADSSGQGTFEDEMTGWVLD